MTVEEFVNEYNQASDKEKYIKKHILQDKYVPYAEKIARCKNIIENTSYVDVNNRKVFKQNSPNQYLFFVMCLIEIYTDIEITDVLKDFDKLEKCQSTILIINMLPTYEKSNWDMLLSMISNDLMENTRSLVGWIDNKFDVLNMINNLFSNVDAENIKE